MIPRLSLVIRLDAPGDAPALERLARLDGQRPPAGPALLAEVDGRLHAALVLADGSVMADPFVPTADLVAVLRMRADRMAAEQRAAMPSLRERLAALLHRDRRSLPARA